VHSAVGHAPLEKGVLYIPLETGVPSLLLSITRSAYSEWVLVVHCSSQLSASRKKVLILLIGCTFRKRGISLSIFHILSFTYGIGILNPARVQV
jgi:hypothetical protein